MRLTRFLCLALGLAACGGDAPPQRPNVVLIMLDTTRADHLGPFSDQDPSLTPFLDHLATRCVVFENAWAAASCTAPSIASMFTGLVPPRHGVESNLLAQAGPKPRDQSVRDYLSSMDLVALPSSVPTLTEHLHAAGYQTLGIGSNPNFCEAMGFARGFDHFSGHSSRDASAMAAELRRLAQRLEPGRPTFTYLHFMDAHAPYHQKRPWCPHDEAEACASTCRYRSEISFLDAELERICTEMGWLDDDNAMLILVTDHGEEFGDHGDIMHRFSVHQELARAGLMWMAPGLEPDRSSAPVHHVDLLPTILARLDLSPPEETDGMALFTTGAGEIDVERPLLTCRKDNSQERQLWGLTSGPWRLLLEEPSGVEKLYHLRRDPREKHNVVEEQPEVLAEMRQRLERMRAELQPLPRERVTVDLSEQLNEELQHLGYVGDE